MRIRILLISAFALIAGENIGRAQLFSPLQSLQSNEKLDNAGGLSGDRRFLRQNRKRGDFVGRSNDNPQGFVGDTQGRTQGRVQTAVSTLREVPLVHVNTPRPAASRTGMYEPRLRIGFDVTVLPAANPAQQLQKRLARSVKVKSPDGIQVSMDGRVATLRGEVDSVKAREMAGLIAQFEPGVEEVKNELVYRPAPLRLSPQEQGDAADRR